jgi:hypothetical protein
MDVDPISAIAIAIDKRLEPYFPRNRWTLLHVPSVVSVEEMKRHILRVPLLLLAFKRIVPESEGRRFKGEVEWSLNIIVSNQHTGNSARFTGDQHGPGLYPALATTIAAINGWTNPEMGTFFVQDVEQSYAVGWGDMLTAIATIDFKVGIGFGDVLGEVGAAPPFLQLLTNWQVSDSPDAGPSDEINMPEIPEEE